MRVTIVGAGLAGLMAGRALVAAGHDVVLVDKGRSPGGRLATRRIGGARVDHGAQFFTVRTDAFAAHVDAWTDAGLVHEWCRGFTTPGDGFARYAVRGGMNALAKHLAVGLDVRCDSLAFALHRGRGPHPWDLLLDNGTTLASDAVIVTCPLPQTYSLLVTAEVTMPDVLWRTDYDRTLSLLAVLDRPSAVPAPGGLQSDPHFTFVGDNQAKGVSMLPALTLHADPTWSREHWDGDRAGTEAALVELARPWIGDAQIMASEVKRWRFATPRSIWPEAHWSPDGAPSLVAAGDAFAGPRVEGAALSGLSAAAALLR